MPKKVGSARAAAVAGSRSAQGAARAKVGGKARSGFKDAFKDLNLFPSGNDQADPASLFAGLAPKRAARRRKRRRKR